MTQWILTSSILILTVLLIRAVGRDRLSARLRYALWGLVLLRLLLPFSIGESALSLQSRLPESGSEIISAVTAHRVHTANGETFVIPAEDYEEIIFNATNETTDTTATTQTTQTNEMTQTTVPVQQQTAEVQTAPAPNVGEVLAVLWLLGMVIVGGVFLVSNVRFWLRLGRSRVRVMTETVPVYQSAAVETPCLFGFLRPAVYVTPALVGDTLALRHVLAHELTHYRHGDHIWSLLRCVCVTVHWYNPLVWVAAFLSQKDGELACDEGALRRLGSEERTAYAKTLLDLTCVGYRGMLTAATSMTGSESDLKTRVLRIVKNPRMPRYVIPVVLILAVVLALAVFTDSPDQMEGTWYGAWVETDTYPAWENLITVRATFRDGRVRVMRFENDELIVTQDYTYTIKDDMLQLGHADYDYTEEYSFVRIGENSIEFVDSDSWIWFSLLTKGDPKEYTLVKDELMEILRVWDMTRDEEWEIATPQYIEGFVVDTLQRAEILSEKPMPDPLTYTDYCYGITAEENGRAVELILCDGWLYRDGMGYELADVEPLLRRFAEVVWEPAGNIVDECGTEYTLGYVLNGPYVEMDTRHDYRDIRYYAIENEVEWERAWKEALAHSIAEEYDGDGVAFYVTGVTHNDFILNVYADGTMVYFEPKEDGNYGDPYVEHYIPIKDAPKMRKLLEPYLQTYAECIAKAERQQKIHGAWQLIESPDSRVTAIDATFNTNLSYVPAERDAYIAATVDGCIVEMRFDIYLQDDLFHVRWFDGSEKVVPYELTDDILTLHAEEGDWVFKQGELQYNEQTADVIRLKQRNYDGKTVYLNLSDEKLAELESLLRAGMIPSEPNIIYVNEEYYKLIGLEEAFGADDITISDRGTMHFNGEGYDLTNWDEIEAFFGTLYRVAY